MAAHYYVTWNKYTETSNEPQSKYFASRKRAEAYAAKIKPRDDVSGVRVEGGKPTVRLV
jgi:hypothetical protein